MTTVKEASAACRGVEIRFCSAASLSRPAFSSRLRGGGRMAWRLPERSSGLHRRPPRSVVSSLCA